MTNNCITIVGLNELKFESFSKAENQKKKEKLAQKFLLMQLTKLFSNYGNFMLILLCFYNLRNNFSSKKDEKKTMQQQKKQMVDFFDSEKNFFFFFCKKVRIY